MRYFLPILVLVVLAGCGGGTVSTSEAGVKESVANVQISLDAVRQAIEEANRALGSVAVPITQSQSVESIAVVRAAIRRGGEQQAEVKSQLARLAILGESIEMERSKLRKEKADLEAEASLLSMGFYGSLAVAIVYLLIHFFNSPHRKVELELKRLEVKKKELEIRNLESRRDIT